VLIRREGLADVAAVSAVHAGAFPVPSGAQAPVEVGLLAELRADAAWLPRLSLVAVVDGEVIGHAVCTRAVLEPAGTPVLGLGPLAVLPVHQGQGAGSALMHALLAAAEACDEPLVGLLGEPAFYRRFGFVPARDLAVEAPDPAWGEYFQVRALATYSTALRGRFRYARPFDHL
jgi:putative acetyltransferase